MTTEIDYCVDENLVNTLPKVVSPSGRFYLIVKQYNTKKGYIGHSRGLIYRVSDDKLVGDIKRNYSHFHKSWVVKNGEEYIISGTRYVDQTIINLDKEKTYQSPKNDSNSFCWASSLLSPDGNILVVSGCHWACPYEIRFYDFTNPEQGWPELHLLDKNGDPTWLDDDDMSDPQFNEDGTINIFHSQKYYLPTNQLEYEVLRDDKVSDEEFEKESNWENRIEGKHTLQKIDGNMVITDTWKSEAYQIKEQKEEEARIKHEAWLADFRSIDPLYLECQKHLPQMKHKGCATYGTTYENWCPDFKEKETRWCYRIVEKDQDTKQGYTVDLEWAVKTGPIKLVIWKDGNSSENKFYSHSVEDMQKAFEYAKSLETLNDR